MKLFLITILLIILFYYIQYKINIYFKSNYLILNNNIKNLKNVTIRSLLIDKTNPESIIELKDFSGLYQQISSVETQII